jgi:hypothetical protein
MTIERIISVTFKDNINQKTIDRFFLGIDKLSQLFKEEVIMTMYHSTLRHYEKNLSSAVDASNYADCVSIWKFENEDSIENFLNDSRHKNIAKDYFKDAVATRTVINIKK